MIPTGRLAAHFVLAAWVSFASLAWAAEFTDRGNRFTYLDSDNPFYPHKDFPKLITPQWVGEEGVEAVVILSIDDMRDSAKYEQFLRPILERLKQIDGRAPVSIFANTIQPDDPQLQTWLREGLSLEVHTLTHPCPLLQKGSFTNAWNTYHGGVDLLNQVPGNQPVAFRMPCCDSMNSPSPRFYSEIFNRTSGAGNFLQIDSSVMCLLTEASGAGDRFRKYFPAQTNAVTKKSLANFATYIEDYPYPYVINKVCWEFPAMVPSDWEAFNLHGATNPITLADWKAALDIVVEKQGVFTWIFHPHGWSSPEQIVEFIHYAVAKHGKKVKFLTFKEAVERVNKNLLTQIDLQNNIERNTERKITYPLRGWPHKPDLKPTEGTWILDINNDGFQDVLIHSGVEAFLYRLWNPDTQTWKEGWLDKLYIDGKGHVDFTRLSFGVLPSVSGSAVTYGYGSNGRLQAFDNMRWEGWALVADHDDPNSGRLSPWGWKCLTGELDPNVDQGLRLRDMDHDGICEVLISNPRQQDVYTRTEIGEWKKLPDGTWPAGVAIVNERGEDNGVRFVDVNGDGFEDLLYSNEKEYALWLYIHTPKANLGWERGWTFKAREGKRDANPQSAIRNPQSEIPPIVRAGPHRNNGVWFRDGAMWIQNEDTAHLPDVVQRIPFSELLTGGEVPPKSPEESLKAFDMRPGFQIELVASEPLVLDPIAFEWGADGRLWVVEMADYPSGMPEAGRDALPRVRDGRAGSPLPDGGAHGVTRPTAGGRVIFLTDTDDDGRYDTRTVFLDGLNFPTGVMPWRKGVLISAAPDILYAENTDGDGRADLKKVLFTGFVEGNQQHRVNGFEYGLDGWVYAANGDSGGKIAQRGVVERWSGGKWIPETTTSPPQHSNSPPLDIGSYDIRFNPDTLAIETVAGRSQFGRRRDDWGNWFGNNNPTWLWHYHIPIHYLKRNPHLAVKSVKTVLANYDNANRVFATSTPQARFNWADRTFQTTSACSPSPYRDDLFGPDFATSIFISEPANNVVHREVLQPDGVTFTSRRAADEQDREFLASSDNWFRPTMLKTGPDGALYIADMYRLILEHPQYFPEELKNRPDLRAGDDKGRLWRVFPKGAKLRKVPDLTKLGVLDLVTAIDSPNGWERDTSQRLVVEQKNGFKRDDLEWAVERLERFAVESKPLKVRLQSMWTLEGLGAFKTGYTFQLLLDKESVMREHALRIVETKVASEASASSTSQDETLRKIAKEWANDTLEKDLDKLIRDSSPRVQYQLAFVVGGWGPEIAGKVLGGMADGVGSADPNMRAAILSSALPHLSKMLDAVLGSAWSGEVDVRKSGDILRELFALVVATNNREALKVGLERLTDDSSGSYAPWQMSGLVGLAEAAEQRNTSLAKLAAEVGIGVDPLFAQARESVADAASDSSTRTTAIRLLARGPNQQEQDLKTLGGLLGPQQATEIQRAALDSLKGLRLPAVGEALLAGWKSFGPAMRGEVLSAVLTRNEWTQALLQAVEGGAVVAGEIGATQRQKLLTHPSAGIRERAQKLFTAVNADRQTVVKRYAGVAELKGDTTRGAALFAANCATCHQFKGQGVAVGPDLGTMADKSVQSLLTAILDPGQAVDAAFTSYNVTMKDGREFAGVIAAETPNSFTLRLPGGTEETVLRSQMEQFRASTLSLMPEGLEATLPPQEMADLVAYLLGN